VDQLKVLSGGLQQSKRAILGFDSVEARPKILTFGAIESSSTALQMYTSMLPTTPRRRLPDDLSKTPNSSPPAPFFSDVTDIFSEATILSDASDGLLENPPAFSTPLRPSIEQDNIQEDYNDEEWQDNLLCRVIFNMDGFIKEKVQGIVRR
jgi:hypothetical protein